LSPSLVIKGWDESVIEMTVGEVSRIHCSPDYAYGSGGFPAWGIQPDSELVCLHVNSWELSPMFEMYLTPQQLFAAPL
jgi:hypothetical protein